MNRFNVKKLGFAFGLTGALIYLGCMIGYFQYYKNGCAVIGSILRNHSNFYPWMAYWGLYSGFLQCATKEINAIRLVHMVPYSPRPLGPGLSFEKGF